MTTRRALWRPRHQDIRRPRLGSASGGVPPGAGGCRSDEYGPFLAHFAADGRQLERLSPCNGGLPPVYAKRRPNRGMEGLTITPDGRWLVGVMQAPLENPTSAGVRNVSRLTRILFRNIATGATREYAYLLEDPTLQGNSEILALSNTKFLVLERDGNFASSGSTRSAWPRKPSR
jgi:hypothetical protein